MNRRALMAMLAGGGAAVLSVCIFPLSLFGRETRTAHRTYRIEDGTWLTIDNGNGSMTVERYDGDDVNVTLTMHGPSGSLDATSVDHSRTSDGLLLTVHPGANDVSVGVTVRYPKSTKIRGVRTDNGSIDADVFATGNATVETLNGSIDANVFAIDGETEIHTQNGSIDASVASDLDASLSASTQQGNFHDDGLHLSEGHASEMGIEGVLGDGSNDLSITTENGDVSLSPLAE